MISVISRVLAFALVLLIGSPVCWCCARSNAPVIKKEAVRSCCAHKSESESQKPEGKRESCPCPGSVAQRDLAKNTQVAPPPVLAAPLVVVSFEFLPHLTAVETDRVVPWHDTGPPHERTPVYLRQRALLL